jgi:hypothetical protein
MEAGRLGQYGSKTVTTNDNGDLSTWGPLLTANDQFKCHAHVH